jgi:mitotic spindle assembly checkpoint protein MAD1
MQRTNEESDMDVIREELRKQAEYHRILEGTNAKLTSEVTILRDRQTSVEVLREQNRGLEHKLQYMESLRDKVAQLEAELEASRAEREQWFVSSSFIYFFASTIPLRASNHAQLPSSLPSTPSKNATPSISQTQTITQLRLQHASLLEEHGSTLASLRTLESTNASLNDLLSSSASEIEKLKETAQELRNTTRKADTRTRLAEREVEFLQALVESYESEEAQKEDTKVDERNLARITELESLLSEYKSTLSSIATAPPSPSKPSQETLDQLGGLRSELEECKKENTQHLETIDKLEQELFELSGEIAGGRHVPPGKRVLQLADNPEQQWFDLRQTIMDKLKEENSALLKRLHDLESSVASANTTTPSESSPHDNEELVPRASYDVLQSSLTNLEQTLAQKEKRLKRLQEVFTSKSGEFRDAIGSILGIRLAFYPNGQVRLTSVYDPNASFVFQHTSNNDKGSSGTSGNNVKMQLVAQGEGGPQDLPSMMRYWIENEQCLPGFMASITLECYEKSKTSGGVGDPDMSV